MAANETTASTLSFCLYHLAAHPATQDAAQKEIDAQGPDFTPSPENLDQLPYLTAVMRWVTATWSPSELNLRRSNLSSGLLIAESKACRLAEPPDLFQVHHYVVIWPALNP